MVVESSSPCLIEQCETTQIRDNSKGSDNMTKMTIMQYNSIDSSNYIPSPTSNQHQPIDTNYRSQQESAPYYQLQPDSSQIRIIDEVSASLTESDTYPPSTSTYVISQYDLISPHEPLNTQVDISPRENGIRQQVIERQTARILRSNDHFADTMEDRLVRWRPTESQFNIDATFAGVHPYHQFDATQMFDENGSTNATILGTIRSWFLSDNSETARGASTNTDQNSLSFPFSSFQEPERASNDQQFNGGFQSGFQDANTALVTSDEPNLALLQCLNLVENSSNSIIRGQPTRMTYPQYTPDALPFGLNFEKSRNPLEDELFPVYRIQDDSVIEELLSENVMTCCIASVQGWRISIC